MMKSPSNRLRVLDLFSGIGGFSLGLERAGMETVAFCEMDEFCHKVLKKHWPHIPIHKDVRTLNGYEYRGKVDLICGGFPCQDISIAGLGAGLAGGRSGLWFEFRRLIQEIQPNWVIIENVSALRSRGLEQVLRSLAEIGYDAEWHCIPAAYVGLPHCRDRIWIVAYPQRIGRQGLTTQSLQRIASLSWSENVRRAKNWRERPDLYTPMLCGTGNGIPDRSHRLGTLGNAVTPLLPELIGIAIIEAHEASFL